MSKGMKLLEYMVANAPVELTRVVLSLAEGCKVIAKSVNNAGLADILGTTGETNVQGETVQKLDDYSNKVIMDFLKVSETCAGYLSEENEGIVTISPNGTYIISVDPLDGSSNIDVVAPIGTIFNICERLSTKGSAATEADFYQKGNATKAAGYVIYGSSTMMVISIGKGVQGFTLSTQDGDFYLSHPDMTIPAKGKIYSLNQGNIGKYTDGLKNYINWCSESDKETSRPYSLRYIGSMVGDMHRNFIKGGIFIYPANKGEAKGKLRLLYECIPMSYLAEQAGGKATDGKERILDLQPVELHERTAIYIGSAETVTHCMSFLNN
jgi:fructose-1,6-bisphosphatase I